ncbi:MAG: HAD-IA family hydrolase [Bacteroidota bacterium]
MPARLPEPGFVYFDLDDTILDHRKAEKRALADVRVQHSDILGTFNKKTIEDVYHEGNVKLWHQYGAGEITKPQLQRKRFEYLLDGLAIKGVNPDKMGAYYIERYTHYWDYIEGAEQAFFQIAEKYPVGVLTNGFAKTQHKKLAQFATMRDKLASIVVSEEFGYMKPHPKLFAYAAEQAETPPENIVYVGDSMHSDVKGGQQAGWTVIWYAPQTEEAPANVHHARNWDDVTSFLI